MQYRFYFFDITYTKKVLIVSKSSIICVFQTLITFFFGTVFINRKNGLYQYRG